MSSYKINAPNGGQINSLGVGTSASNVDGTIISTGDIKAFYSSDSRLKTNVEPISGALDKLSKIRGVYFDWIPTPGVHDNEGHDIGVIAQEVESVFPEVVTTRSNGYKAVKYEKLIALLIQSNKELLARIEKLEQ